MGVIERKENNNIVECLIDSTNILHSEYDQSNKTLILTFKAGTRYKYLDIQHRDYVRFEVSESQGTVFSKTLKDYKTEKLDKVDITPIKERINEIKGNNEQIR